MMNFKNIFLVLFVIFSVSIVSAQDKKPERLIIVTIDGLRWQDVFRGIDQQIVKDPTTKGSLNTVEKIYSSREQLMPFFWKVLSKKAALYGNQDLGSSVLVSNPYHFSYPGYSELLCGKVDLKINSNGYPENPNKNIFDVLIANASYKNKAAAFGAWEAFSRIFHESTANYPVFSSFKPYKNSKSKNTTLINSMLENSFKPWFEDESLDVFPHTMAMDYLKTQKPKAVFIGYGETDEWAHSGNYRYYLDAMKNTDQFLSELWDFIQTTPEYKDNTVLLVTVDHGRGEGKAWIDHGSDVKGADQIWFAIYHPGLKKTGEQKSSPNFYQKDLSPTLLKILGQDPKALNPESIIIKELL